MFRMMCYARQYIWEVYIVFCSNCGSKLVDGAKFCSECGAKVEVRLDPDLLSDIRDDFADTIAEAPKKAKAATSTVSFDWSSVIDESHKKVVTDIKSPWDTGLDEYDTASAPEPAAPQAPDYEDTVVLDKDEKAAFDAIFNIGDEAPFEDKKRTLTFIDIMKQERAEQSSFDPADIDGETDFFKSIDSALASADDDQTQGFTDLKRDIVSELEHNNPVAPPQTFVVEEKEEEPPIEDKKNKIEEKIRSLFGKKEEPIEIQKPLEIDNLAEQEYEDLKAEDFLPADEEEPEIDTAKNDLEAELAKILGKNSVFGDDLDMFEDDDEPAETFDAVVEEPAPEVEEPAPEVVEEPVEIVEEPARVVIAQPSEAKAKLEADIAKMLGRVRTTNFNAVTAAPAEEVAEEPAPEVEEPVAETIEEPVEAAAEPAVEVAEEPAAAVEEVVEEKPAEEDAYLDYVPRRRSSRLETYNDDDDFEDDEDFEDEEDFDVELDNINDNMTDTVEVAPAAVDAVTYDDDEDGPSVDDHDYIDAVKETYDNSQFGAEEVEPEASEADVDAEIAALQNRLAELLGMKGINVEPVQAVPAGESYLSAEEDLVFSSIDGEEYLESIETNLAEAEGRSVEEMIAETQSGEGVAPVLGTNLVEIEEGTPDPVKTFYDFPELSNLVPPAGEEGIKLIFSDKLEDHLEHPIEVELPTEDPATPNLSATEAPEATGKVVISPAKAELEAEVAKLFGGGDTPAEPEVEAPVETAPVEEAPAAEEPVEEMNDFDRAIARLEQMDTSPKSEELLFSDMPGGSLLDVLEDVDQPAEEKPLEEMNDFDRAVAMHAMRDAAAKAEEETVGTFPERIVAPEPEEPAAPEAPAEPEAPLGEDLTFTSVDDGQALDIEKELADLGFDLEADAPAFEEEDMLFTSASTDVSDNLTEEQKAEAEPAPGLSLDELELNLAADAGNTDDIEATRKIEKFYTLYRKNEEFQKLLDAEYEKLQTDPELEKIGDTPGLPGVTADTITVEEYSAGLKQLKEEGAITTEAAKEAENLIKTKTEAVSEAPAAAVEVKDAAVGAAAGAAGAAVAAKVGNEVKEAAKPAPAADQDEKGGGVLTVIAIVVAVLLVFLLAIILILQLAPDSSIAFKLNEMIGNFTNFISANDANTDILV
jgi:hypothetical protein